MAQICSRSQQLWEEGLVRLLGSLALIWSLVPFVPAGQCGELERAQRLEETLRVGRDKLAEQEEGLKLCKILKTHS